jgi:hypothetical protein
MAFLFCGAWSPDTAREDSQTRGLLEDVLGAGRAANLNINELADYLGLDHPAISRMKVCRDAGPGILRFANLPARWWIAFISLRAKRYCLRVVTDMQIDKLIAFLNVLQVERLEAQEKRMAKAALPDTADLRKRA